MATDVTRSRAHARLAWAAAALAASLALGAADAAKNTIFGSELSAPNFPNSTSQDTYNALQLASQIGGHSCMTWHWGESSSLQPVVALAPSMRQFGLKVMMQMATTFLGNPAPPQPLKPSFADPDTKARFIRDVTMMAIAKPDYLVITTEVNLMYRFNRPEFDNFLPLYRQAYSTVKLFSPKTKVGVSFLYKLWVGNYFIDHIDLPSMVTPYDFIAFTSYPEDLVRDGSYASIADIPPSWYGLARIAYPGQAIVFSEVGWASKGYGTPELQAEFVRNLPRLMSTTHPELVTWAMLYDVQYFSRSLLTPSAVDFLTNLGVDIDTLFLHFNGMGLLNGDGTPKPGLDDARNLVFPAP